MNEYNLVFEKGIYICAATVQYTPPQGNKWSADSDVDYEGDFDIIDMLVWESDDETQYPVDKHSITWEDVVRHYEVMMETTQLEFELASVEDDEDFWED